MVNKYTLYLDESKFFDKTSSKYLFAVAGVIIPDDESDTISQQIIKLKQSVWPKREDFTKVVLHEADVRSNNSKILDKQPEYSALLNKDGNKSKIIKGIGEIINKFDINILGAVVDQTSLERTYNITMEKNVFLSYKIALTQIIENFVAFLKLYDGVDGIVLESRRTGIKDVEDRRVKKVYAKVLAHGTLIYEGVEIQNQIDCIKFIGKYENNQLLQIADFIPRPILLAASNTGQSKPSIYKTAIRKHRFTAFQINGAKKFGVKEIK